MTLFYMKEKLEAILVVKEKKIIALDCNLFLTDKKIQQPIQMLINYFDSAAKIYHNEQKIFVVRDGFSGEDFLNDVERADYRLAFLNSWKVDLDTYRAERENMLKNYANKSLEDK